MKGKDTKEQSTDEVLAVPVSENGNSKENAPLEEVLDAVQAQDELSQVASNEENKDESSDVQLTDQSEPEGTDETVSPEAIPESKDATQTVIDSIAIDAEEDEALPVGKSISLGPLSIPIPDISVDSFYKNKKLKRKVRMGILGYVSLVILPVFFIAWQAKGDFDTVDEERTTIDSRYLDPLLGIDLAEKQQTEQGLYQGFQMTRDPLYALFVLESIAVETNVRYTLPMYSMNTRNVEEGIGIQIAATVRGELPDLLAFVEETQKLQPLFHTTSFNLARENIEEGTGYALSVTHTVAIRPLLQDRIDEISEKQEAETSIPYPVPGVDEIIERITALRIVEYLNKGESAIGKQNVFSL